MRKMTIYVGIDNGLDGAIVAIDDAGKIVVRHTMPVIKGAKSRREYDMQQITTMLSNIQQFAFSSGQLPVVVGLEKAQVTHIAGKNSCFMMGYCYGMMQGILNSMKISYVVFRAVDWQKEIFNGMSGTDTKQKSIIYAKRKYPEQDWRKSDRSTNEHDGLTDALCIANYLKIKESGKQ